MKNQMDYGLVFIPIFSILLNSCQLLRPSLRFDEPNDKGLHLQTIKTHGEGLVKLSLKSDTKGFRCQTPQEASKIFSRSARDKMFSDQKWGLPKLEVRRAQKFVQTGVVNCTGKKEEYTVTFPKPLPAGLFRFHVVEQGHIKGKVVGRAHFMPLFPDKNSGPDQLLQGANILKVGVNQDTINAIELDRTDWWTLPEDTQGSYSITFEQNGHPGDVSVELYHRGGNGLKMIASIEEKKPRNFLLSDIHFIKVASTVFSSERKYSLSLQKNKIETQLNTVLTRSGGTMKILDFFHQGDHATVITVAAGKQKGLKEGMEINILGSKQNLPLFNCRVTYVGTSESLCETSTKVEMNAKHRALLVL